MDVQLKKDRLQQARQKFGRPFAHERNSTHQHVQGPAYWTSERVAALAAENEERRKARQPRKAWS